MDTIRSSDCSTAPDEITATGRILVIGPPRSGTTWVEQVLGRATSARVVHEPDNETCNPFALRAKTPLGRFPVVVVVLRHPLNVVGSHVALGWGPSGLDSHPLLHQGLARVPWVPAVAPDATPLQRLAWQIGVFTSALETAVQRNPGWLVVSHEALCGDPAAGFKSLCAALGVPWTEEAAGFLAASDRPGKGLETRRVAAEQPTNWSRHLTIAQAQEVVEVLSAFPDRLYGGASVP